MILDACGGLPQQSTGSNDRAFVFLSLLARYNGLAGQTASLVTDWLLSESRFVVIVVVLLLSFEASRLWQSIAVSLVDRRYTKQQLLFVTLMPADVHGSPFNSTGTSRSRCNLLGQCSSLADFLDVLPFTSSDNLRLGLGLGSVLIAGLTVLLLHSEHQQSLFHNG